MLFLIGALYLDENDSIIVGDPCYAVEPEQRLLFNPNWRPEEKGDVTPINGRHRVYVNMTTTHIMSHLPMVSDVILWRDRDWHDPEIPYFLGEDIRKKELAFTSKDAFPVDSGLVMLGNSQILKDWNAEQAQDRFYKAAAQIMRCGVVPHYVRSRWEESGIGLDTTSTAFSFMTPYGDGYYEASIITESKTGIDRGIHIQLSDRWTIKYIAMPSWLKERREQQKEEKSDE